MKDVLGNHLQDLIFPFRSLVEHHPTIAKDQSESINLERKFYLDCSSDTLCTRVEFGRVTCWSQTLRSWRRWTHRKSTRKDPMRKVMFHKEKRRIYFPIEDGRIRTPGREQELRISTLKRHRPIQGESDIDFLGESEGSLPQPYDSLLDAGEAINYFRSWLGCRWSEWDGVVLLQPWQSQYHWWSLCWLCFAYATGPYFCGGLDPFRGKLLASDRMINAAIMKRGFVYICSSGTTNVPIKRATTGTSALRNHMELEKQKRHTARLRATSRSRHSCATIRTCFFSRFFLRPLTRSRSTRSSSPSDLMTRFHPVLRVSSHITQHRS